MLRLDLWQLAVPQDEFVVVTGSAAKGWTQTWSQSWTWTWTWTWTRSQPQHGAVGGWDSWDEREWIPAGIMALNKSLNISPVASLPLPFHQMLTAICEVVQTSPTQQKSCRGYPRLGSSQCLSTRLARHASKSHPKCSSATHSAEFPNLHPASGHTILFFHVKSYVFCANSIC